MTVDTTTEPNSKLPIYIRHAPLIIGLAMGLALAAAFPFAVAKYESITRGHTTNPAVIGSEIPTVIDVPVIGNKPGDQAGA